MDSDKPNSGTALGFSFRRLALVLLVLIAFRGATGGIRELVTDGNWLAGILGVIIVALLKSLETDRDVVRDTEGEFIPVSDVRSVKSD